MAVTATLDSVGALVAGKGMPAEQAHLLAEYIADRCAGLSVASAHSSTFSALRNDTFLTREMCLDRSQISAWIALVRGTRTVRSRDGRVAGGHPGLVEALAAGALDGSAMNRYEQLAVRAAHGLAQPCAPG